MKHDAVQFGWNIGRNVNCNSNKINTVMYFCITGTKYYYIIVYCTYITVLILLLSVTVDKQGCSLKIFIWWNAPPALLPFPFHSLLASFPFP